MGMLGSQSGTRTGWLLPLQQQPTHKAHNAFEVESEWPCSLPWKRQAAAVEVEVAVEYDDVICEPGRLRTEPLTGPSLMSSVCCPF